MSRGLWFVAGAGAGVLAVVRGRRAAQALTVDGLSDRINGLVAGARVLADEVAAGRAEKSTELRERLAPPAPLAASGTPAPRELDTPRTEQEESTP